MKHSSSDWVHGELRVPVFAWQQGYGAFTVSPRDVSQITAYIRGQDEHHRQRSFEEEYRALLDEYGVPYDERYLW